MIWRRWVTESPSSATQTSSDHLDRRPRNTRMRPPQSGLVQVGFLECCNGVLPPGYRSVSNGIEKLEAGSGRLLCGCSARVRNGKLDFQEVATRVRAGP